MTDLHPTIEFWTHACSLWFPAGAARERRGPLCHATPGDAFQGQTAANCLHRVWVRVWMRVQGAGAGSAPDLHVVEDDAVHEARPGPDPRPRTHGHVRPQLRARVHLGAAAGAAGASETTKSGRAPKQARAGAGRTARGGGRVRALAPGCTNTFPVTAGPSGLRASADGNSLESTPASRQPASFSPLARGAARGEAKQGASAASAQPDTGKPRQKTCGVWRGIVHFACRREPGFVFRYCAR